MKVIYRITYPNPRLVEPPWNDGPEVAMTLDEILDLVGPLVDSADENAEQ
jgi:hypothetical protein